MTKDKIPIGFAMALAMNPEAMQKFAMLSEEEKQDVITETHSLKSKNEMHRYVDFLVNYKQ